MAVSLSSLDVAGIGNLVGRKMTFSTRIVARVDGMNTLYCLQWCIAGPTYQPSIPLSDHVVLRRSIGS